MARNQILFDVRNHFEFKFQSHDMIHSLKFSNIFQIISHHFQSCFLSYQIMNPSPKNNNRLTIQYSSQIHSNICTIITKLQNQIQKVRNISCRRNWLNFIRFLSIRLHRAENQNIRYIHRDTRSTVLNIVIIFQNQTGSHLILLCINPKIHAQIMKLISKLVIFTFEEASIYTIGIRETNIADINSHRFWLEDSIEK